MPIVRHPVTSSTIASVGYSSGTLEIEFRSGSVYRYSDVPVEVLRGLEASESKGRYFNDAIRDRFTYRRLSSAAGAPLGSRREVPI